MFRSPVVKSIVFVLALGSSPAWGAGIYKWVDENGKIHFGDRPPAVTGGSQAVKVKPVPEGSGTRAPSGSERSKLQRRLLDVFARERAEKKLAAAEEKKRQQELAQRCAHAKHKLGRMKEAGYVYQLDDSGNELIYSREERTKSTRKLEKSITKYCK